MSRMSRGLITSLVRITGIILLLLPSASMLRAQNTDPARLNSGQISPFGMVPDSTVQGNDKPPKPRKPLESYYFNDSIRARQVFSWNFNPYNNNIRIIEVDTMLNRFQLDYPYFYDSDVGSAYLGQLGGPTVPLNYFLRPSYRDFTFLESFDTYLYTPERAKFFNVKKPFTQLAYYTSGQKTKAEEQLRVLHAQNASPSSGFNLDYRNRGTRGMYARQRTTDKNLSLAGSYSGKKYSIHGGYIYNMANVNENGGVNGLWQIRDTIIDLPENIIMNLADSKTRYKGHTYYMTHSYGLTLSRLTEDDFSIANSTTLFIGNSLEYTRFRKNYSDTRAGTVSQDAETGEYYEFFNNWYLHPTITNDSIQESRFDGKVFVEFQPYNRQGVLGTLSGGMGYSRHAYYYFTPEQYLRESDGVKKDSYYLYGSANGSFKHYISWNADAQYYMAGYRNQDMRLRGDMTFTVLTKGSKPVTLSVEVLHNRQSPDYWSLNYFSNHYMWNNSFDKEIETRLSARLLIDPIGMEVGAEQSAIKHKIYYDAQSLPQQYDGTLSMSGVYLRKDFRAGGFHFNNRVLLQWSSAQEVAPVPMFSANGSYYFEFNVVKNVLRMQLGIDGYYNSKYYAFGYNPALAKFYNQREQKLGDYIWTDVWATGKWKRLRFVLKLQHLNYDMFGGRNYFQVLHQPLNRRMFKIGISWGFYD